MLDVPHPETDSDGLFKLPDSIPKFTITLVDAGMVAQLTDEESSTFIGLLAAVGEGNGRSAAEFALRFSIENHMGGKEQELFKKEMEALFAERCQGYGTHVDVGHVLRGVLGLIRDHQVRIDSNYATLVVNVLCIESLARRVCPSYNLLDAAKPMLQTYRKLCFDEDGVTPKKNQKLLKRAKSMMPLMYSKKDRADAAFFKKIAAERGPLSLAAP
jgi:predicted unusual protein kinase regulating ubiquinone biosynthesis (AarF/ABC1/UbiB family)